MTLLGNRYRLSWTMTSKRVYFILSSFHANKHFKTYYKQTQNGCEIVFTQNNQIQVVQ